MTDNVITVAEYHMLLAEDAKHRNKFGAVAVIDEVYGRFDSTGEHERWYALLRLRDLGVIADLHRQVQFPLIVNGVLVAKYLSDFTYTEDGVQIVEDYKSSATRTPVYRLKKRLMLACYGFDIRETGR